MTEEHDHDKLRIGDRFEDDEPYHDEKREVEQYLANLLKHISEDGERFNPRSLTVDGEGVPTNADLFSGEYGYLEGVPSSFTPEEHGNEAHSETFASDTDVFSGGYGDLEGVPSSFTPEAHGNEAHSETFAIDGDEQPPQPHGNGAHIEEYITEDDIGDIGGFSGEYGDLSGIPSTFTPEEHGNAAHTEEYITEDDIGDVDPDLDHLDVETINDTTVYLSDSFDQAELGDAVDYLTGDYDGGEIILPDGEFEDEWAITGDNITLRGRSKETTLRLPDGMDEPSQCLTIAADGVTVENLTIDGNKNGQTLDSYNSQELQHADGIGIYGDNCTIRDVDVYRAQSHSIIVWNWNNDEGAANAALPPEAERFGNVIEDCYVEDNGTAENERASLDSVESRRTIFRDNEVIGGDYTIVGVTIHTGDDIIIRGNHIDNPDGLGFQIHSDAHNVLVDGNTVRAHGGLQTYNSVDDVRFVNNTFDLGSYPTGIEFQDTTTNVRFANNSAVQQGGTRLLRAQVDTEHIQIVDNTFHEMYVEVACETPGAVLRGNDFVDYVDVWPVQMSDAVGVAIQNNYIHMDPDGDSISGSIVLDDGIDCLVTENTIVNGDGVFEGGGSEGNEIRDNHEIDE